MTNTRANSIGTGGSAIGLTKLNAGPLILSGSNTSSGRTMINAGGLQMAHSAVLGGNSTSSPVTSGTPLDRNGFNTSKVHSLSLNDAGDSSSSVLINNRTTTNAMFFRSVVLAADSTIRTAGKKSLTLGSSTRVNGTTSNSALTVDGARSFNFYLNRMSHCRDRGNSFVGNAFDVGITGPRDGMEIIAFFESESIRTGVMSFLRLDIYKLFIPIKKKLS